MEFLYTVEKGINGQWNVMMLTSEVIVNIETRDLADIIAKSLNEAFNEGKRIGQDDMKEKIIKRLFS
ncbi:hypothetical protein [Paenibacillus sp. Marseille-Q4541]|uniref:hypothetical protein n=1 Tax=Paenibacillus sp. Marseille-Q4541 TaxID=2831522 RepID=UPI001BADC398|nr:hypothetical protein [Paenibacillus sp. Marseille-Q4541]